MDIKYRIIKKDIINRQIIVRFFTAAMTELILAAELDADGLPVNLVDGNPINCRTDYMVSFPLRVLTPAEETSLIMAHCPWKWFEDEERLIKSKTVADSEISSIFAAIEAMTVATNTLTFVTQVPTTPEAIKAANIKKIDLDADRIYTDVLGARGPSYTTAESQSLVYKAAGYTGTVPDYVQSWLTANTKGFTTAKQAANDILVQAAGWRGADSAIYANRLLAKKNVINDVTTAMSQWNDFVIYIRSQLGI